MKSWKVETLNEPCDMRVKIEGIYRGGGEGKAPAVTTSHPEGR